MFKVAITGNIGSGKSTVLGFFKKNKYFVSSSDEIIKKIYDHQNYRAAVLKCLNIKNSDFKNEILKKIKDPTFNTKLKRKLYPIMNRLRNNSIHSHHTKKKLFFEVPLLFEEKLEKNYDLIIFISSNYNKRLKRILNKGMTRDYFETMNSYQLPNSIKCIKSDITILNNGSIFDLQESLNWCNKSI